MAKPASSGCNLNSHCFYREKTQQPVMSEDALEVFIRQHIDAQPADEVHFAWHEGEPTLCGLDFYRCAAALQQKYAGEKRIYNAFQTNGILLDDAWCQFFKEQGWLVGISLDGPPARHDEFHVSRSDNPVVHHQVLRAIESLNAHDVEFTLLVSVNRLNCQHPQQLYRYLRELGTPFLHFIPHLEMNDHQQPTGYSVTARQWGQFLCEVFDVWVHEDVGRVFVQLFDSTLGIWNGFSSRMCSLGETCDHAFGVESFRHGNRHHTSLKGINASAEAGEFGQYKTRSLPDQCRKCSVLRLCNGDCPKHRDASGKSALCEGYKSFFQYTSPYMKVMRDLIRLQHSPMELMGMLGKNK